MAAGLLLPHLAQGDVSGIWPCAVRAAAHKALCAAQGLQQRAGGRCAGWQHTQRKLNKTCCRLFQGPSQGCGKDWQPYIQAPAWHKGFYILLRLKEIALSACISGAAHLAASC
jgi:hypothetical protein